MHDAEEPNRRARGRIRMERILDAADSMLRQRDEADVSLQEVAARADLPPASLYHYFSSSQALMLELAKRYLNAFEMLAREDLDPERIETWSDLSRLHCERALKFYHDHPVAMRLFLGPETGWQIRSADLATNHRIGRIQYDRLLAHFVVAGSETLANAFAVSMTIGDAVWALSFARHGDVTPEMAAESLRARLAYLRLYVGEHVEKRAAPPQSIRPAFSR
jgi:AcrR family transcriptional regulator